MIWTPDGCRECDSGNHENCLVVESFMEQDGPQRRFCQCFCGMGRRRTGTIWVAR